MKHYTTTIPFSLENVSGDFKLVYTPFSHRLYHKGELMKKKGFYSSYKLETIDGRVEELKIRRDFRKFVYTIVFQGDKKELEDRLSILDYVIGYLPFLFVFLGGAIGGIIGYYTASFNISVIRQEPRVIKKYAIAVGTTLLSFIFYLILSESILLLIASMSS